MQVSYRQMELMSPLHAVSFVILFVPISLTTINRSSVYIFIIHDPMTVQPLIYQVSAGITLEALYV